MGKPSAPSPPDPAATAAAQTTSNVNTAAANAALNNTNQYTPYGATTYAPTGSYTTPDGQVIPTYSQYTELSPLGQSILTGQQSVANNILPYAGTLSSQAGQAATKPLDVNTPYTSTLQNWQGAGSQLNTPLSAMVQGGANTLANFQSPYADMLAKAPGQIGSTDTPFYPTIASGAQDIKNLQTPYDATLNRGPELLSNDATNAIYNQQKLFLDPQWDQQQSRLQDQLSRQGIPVGSEAYSNASRDLGLDRTRAYQSAQDAAIAGGTQAASNLFSMALSGKNQSLAQQQAALQAAQSGQQLTTAQQQAAFQAALAGQGQSFAQQQAAVQAALSGQQLNNQQQNQAFNQALSGQQANISQQQLQQQQPLALLQQLLGSAPATPSQPIATPVPSSIAPTDVIGAQGQANAARQNAYQGQVASSNATYGGLASIAGAAALAIAV